MKIIHAVHPEDFINYNTQKIREKFLLENLVSPGKIECAYTHYDRMIVGAAMPTGTPLQLNTYDQLKSDYFLARREIGIVNIGSAGSISVDGENFDLQKLDCLYIGKGKQNIQFNSTDAKAPAKYIFFSCPAHQEYPVPAHEARSGHACRTGLTGKQQPPHHQQIHSRRRTEKLPAGSGCDQFQSRAASGTPCRRIPTTAAWKLIFIST
jgi:5-keto 4-deoxyuronate isomerase